MVSFHISILSRNQAFVAMPKHGRVQNPLFLKRFSKKLEKIMTMLYYNFMGISGQMSTHQMYYKTTSLF